MTTRRAGSYVDVGEHFEKVAEAVHQCGELLARQAPAVVPGGAAQFDFR